MKHLILLATVIHMTASMSAQTSITAAQQYQGIAGTGDYGIVSTSANSLSNIDKPIIVVEPWDLINEIDNPITFGLIVNTPNSNYLGNQLTAAGYDIVVLNFTDGGTFVQRNAFVLVELINQINAQKIGNEKIKIIGLSSGAVIARYALAWMEDNNMTHDVSLYASIDGPHKGVSVPPSLQFLYHKFGGSAIPPSGRLHAQLGYDKDLAKQLMYHRNISEGAQMGQDPLFANFFSELQNLNGNGFPHQCTNIAISNGNRSGIKNASAEIGTHLHGWLPEMPPFMLSSNGKITVQSDYAKPLPTQYGWTPSTPEPDTKFELAKDVLGPPFAQTVKSFMVRFDQMDGMERSPGGTVNFYADMGDFFRSQEPAAGVTNEVSGSELPTSFVPTTSALALSTNWFYDFSSNPNLLCTIPFDKFYTPLNLNEEHSSLSTIGSNWLFSMILSSDNVTIPNGEQYNYGINTSNMITENITILSGGKMTINDGVATDLVSKNSTFGNSLPVPALGTTFEVKMETCNNPINITVNGTLQIGDGSRYGILRLKENTRVIVKKDGWLNIFNGSKLILDGGSLVFEKGANVNLQDIGATIEILDGGKIVIGDNAVFNWTGPGYLKINSNSTSGPNITASSPNNNATFFQTTYANYTGGYNKKVIEVANGVLAVDKNLTNFKLINGTIWMGTGALVDVKSPMSFSGVKMKSLNSVAYSYKGIQVYGQQETPYLDLCVIDDADIGLNVLTNTAGINSTAKFANIKRSNFNNCRIGVQVNGKAAKIEGGKFWKNKTGIFLSGAEYTSTISDITSYDNRSAIDVVGTGYDMLETKQVNLYNNVAAGAFMVKSMIRPTCSQINNNYPNSNPFNGCNILLREYSTLNVEPYGLNGQYGGKNSIASTSSHAVVCIEAKGLSLNNGRTNFYTAASNNMSFYGTLQPWYLFMNGTPTILAHKNIWNPTGSPIVNAIDYSIVNNWGNINIDDANPITPDEVDCILPPLDWDGKPGQLINPCPKLEGEGDDLIILDALTKMYQQTPDYVSAISDFAGVVTKSYQTIYEPPVTPPGQDPPTEPAEYVDEFSDCHKIIEFAYETMLQALGEGIGNGSIENLGEITDPVQTVIDAQNALKNYYIQYENGSRKVFEINLEQALIYRLINDRQTALDKLEVLHDYAETEVEQNLLSYYECLVMNEIIIETSEDCLAFSGLNDCVSFLNLPDVELEPTGERPEDPVWEEGYGKTGTPPPAEKDQPAKVQLKKTAKTVDDQVRIFPNPVVNTINVKLPSDIIADEIRIVDITGRTVRTFNSQFADTAILHVELESGTYFIEITNGKQTISRKKVMITR